MINENENDVGKMDGRWHKWQVNYQKGEYERVRPLTEQEL